MKRSIALVIGFLCLFAGWAASVTAADKVTFRLDTSFLPKHGIFFAALGKGFYKDEGLDVDIVPSTGSMATCQIIATGREEFGFSDAGTMVLCRQQDAKVKMIAVIHAKNPFAIVTLERIPIREPKDLEGKTIGIDPGGTLIMMPVFCSLTGVDCKKLNIVTTDNAAKVPGLLAGRFDAIGGYMVSDPPVIVGMGEKPYIIPWSKYGFNAYSNGIIANEKLLAEKPDLVKRFLRATVKGIKFANDNPDEAAKILVSYVPAISPVAAKIGIEMASERLWTDEAQQNGIGFMTDAKWNTVQDNLVKFMNLKEKSAPSQLYTNAFLPGKQ
ncbi:MAG TPA: ABC transporter substrate-binding protein [Candidatus Sulfotelmatobacter sp.]|nr:ABC transporter substrate-binding protein [Candidatus Sulfotelmatobacter sp.]